MLKIATLEDLDHCVEMAKKFANATEYKDYLDDAYVAGMVWDYLASDNNDKIILLYADVGMLAGFRAPMGLGPHDVAVERAWWIEPDARGKQAGKELVEAFEFWAQKVGCKLVTMISLDDKLGKYYEKNGYKLYERAYTKEL